MEFQQVRYFLAITEVGSFTGAAKSCGVSQPALTASIKRLESEFGGELFTRGRSGAKLTALGELVRPRLQRIAREHAAVDEMARNFRSLEAATLRIGVLETVGPARIAPLIREFNARAPGVELELSLERAAVLLQRVADADVDLAIGSTTGALPGWAVTRTLYEERYVVLLPPEHPLLQRSEVALADLHAQPYLDRLSCERRSELVRTCQAHGVELTPVFRSSLEPWVESLVDAGVGLTLIPEFSVGRRGDRARPFVQPGLTRSVHAVRSADRSLSSATSLFWSLLPSERCT